MGNEPVHVVSLALAFRSHRTNFLRAFVGSGRAVCFSSDHARPAYRSCRSAWMRLDSTKVQSAR